VNLDEAQEMRSTETIIADNAKELIESNHDKFAEF
jgi:hypothetical protein